MRHLFVVGEKVVLSESMKKVVEEPEKYQIGIVQCVGSWNIVYVKWNGIDRAIGMRYGEIVDI